MRTDVFCTCTSSVGFHCCTEMLGCLLATVSARGGEAQRPRHPQGAGFVKKLQRPRPEPNGDLGDRAGGCVQPHGDAGDAQDRVLRFFDNVSHQMKHKVRRRARLMEPAGARSDAAFFCSRTIWLNGRNLSVFTLTSRFTCCIVQDPPNHVYLLSHECRLARSKPGRTQKGRYGSPQPLRTYKGKKPPNGNRSVSRQMVNAESSDTQRRRQSLEFFHLCWPLTMAFFSGYTWAQRRSDARFYWACWREASRISPFSHIL